MDEQSDSISLGTAAILVSDPSLKGKLKGPFFSYLKKEGFRLWSHSKGSFDGVHWIYVNINAKTYCYGIPGIPVTTPFGNHAVTIDEFKTIYGIYKKYEESVRQGNVV